MVSMCTKFDANRQNGSRYMAILPLWHLCCQIHHYIATILFDHTATFYQILKKMVHRCNTQNFCWNWAIAMGGDV
uniref:Uncharacterized protein n=1 Tax=Anguilla anguilla TaxID=7936 RepID=A0A0E9VE25_ANGAN